MAARRFAPLLLLLLTACATPDSHNRPSDADRHQFSETVRRSESHPISQCLESALRTNFALTSLKMGKASNDTVRSALLDGAADAEQRTQRLAEFAIWERTQRPDVVAESRFNWCISQQRLAVSLGSVGRRCFSDAAPWAMLQALKRIGVAEDVAVSRVKASMPAQAGVAQLEQVASIMYAVKSQDDEIRLQRGLFAGCVRTTP